MNKLFYLLLVAAGTIIIGSFPPNKLPSLL